MSTCIVKLYIVKTCYTPQMSGQYIVWYGDGFAGFNDIELYDGSGHITSFSDYGNDWYFVEPQVNSHGDVVWLGQKRIISETYSPKPVVTEQQIFLYHNGSLVYYDQLTFSFYNYCPQINDNRQVAYVSYEKTEDERYYTVYLYTIGTDDPVAIYSTDYAITNLHLNINGEMVWQGSDGYDQEIYLYTNGKVINLSDNDYEDTNPQINDSGHVVYETYGGTNYGITLYDGMIGIPALPGEPIEKTPHIETFFFDSMRDFDPQINNIGLIAWYAATNPIEQSGVIYVYDYLNDTLYEEVSPENFYVEGSLRLSNSGQVVWVANDGDDEIFKADPLAIYEFIFHYSTLEGADYYYGHFIDTIFAYDLGAVGYLDNDIKFYETEDGHQGYYTIEKIWTSDAWYGGTFTAPFVLEGDYKDVFVLGYYDAEADYTFVPLNSDIPFTGGLGSEWGYIISSDDPWLDNQNYYQFGHTPTSTKVREADSLQSRYEFKYYYHYTYDTYDGYQYSGDYYTGYFYAPADMFEAGYVWKYQPQGRGGWGVDGVYVIVGKKDGFAHTQEGKLEITAYYDVWNTLQNKAGVGRVEVSSINDTQNPTPLTLEDWTKEKEAGYAILRTAYDYFSFDEEADVFDQFRFVVLGDSQTEFLSNFIGGAIDVGSPVNWLVLRGMVEEILDLYPRPDFVVFLGDMGNWVYDSNYLGGDKWFWNEFIDEFINPLEKAGISVFIAKGNHDVYDYSLLKAYFLEPPFNVITPYEEYILEMGDLSGDTPATFGYNEYVQEHFTKTFNTDIFGKTNPNPLYFSFEYGNSYFVFLDSFYIDESQTILCRDIIWVPNPANPEELISEIIEYERPYQYYGDVTGDQLKWLKQDLENTNQLHKFAFSHYPPISPSGPYDEPLWYVIDENDFDIFFAADKHTYFRADISPANFPGDVYSLIGDQTHTKLQHSVYEVVSGGAGAPFLEDKEIKSPDLFPGLSDMNRWLGFGWVYKYDPNSVGVLSRVWHYIVVDVNGLEVTSTAYKIEGRIAKTWDVSMADYIETPYWISTPFDTFTIGPTIGGFLRYAGAKNFRWWLAVPQQTPLPPSPTPTPPSGWGSTPSSGWGWSFVKPKPTPPPPSSPPILTSTPPSGWNW